MIVRASSAWLFALAFVVSIPASANGERHFVASSLTGAAPTIDGRLDDGAWRHATFHHGLIQETPDEGETASLASRMAIVHDTDALYFAAHMQIEEPVRASISRRDESGNSERIILSLDPYRDRRSAVSFSLTATSVRSDYSHKDDGDRPRDMSFDPVWTGKAHVTDSTWSAEMRIPFSQLRYNDTEEWGININRWTPTRHEDAYWALVPRTESGFASRFAPLVGIADVPQMRHVEVLPYAASWSSTDALDRFSVGADLKMQVSPSLILDGTLNPDFGQVEADPAALNLTAFETIFPEKRPFFVEGSHHFSNIGPTTYFYSRRIGAPPRASLNSSWAETATHTPIRAAAKITGRTPSGWSVGALSALTGPTLAEPSESAEPPPEIEPRTAHGVLRLEHTDPENGRVIGSTLTVLARDLVAGSDIASALVSEAVAGGVDWRERWGNAGDDIYGYAGFSHIRGSEGALEAVQTSSAHYFQRPDAKHVEFDSTLTELSGWNMGAGAARESGEHWIWDLGLGMESPGFEINDLGRLQSADDLEGWASFTYRETEPGPYWRDYSVKMGTRTEWNTVGVRRHTGGEVRLKGTTPRFARLSLDLHGRTQGLDDEATRGGPLVLKDAGGAIHLSASTSYARQTTASIKTVFKRSTLGSYSHEISGEIGLRPHPRLHLQMKPRYTRGEDRRFYIDTLPSGPASTYGSTYVFGNLALERLSTQFRIDIAFWPDLSLQAYAEPYLTAARYSDFGGLIEPESFDLFDLGEDMVETNDDGSITFPSTGRTVGDFRILSFRSNVVLRWEWAPASTFFLVWQQERFGEEAGPVAPAALWETTHAPGAHYLGIKLTRWISLD